ncbi:ABC transporter ATP-binding protein [Nocardioides houyundeii]|uniref:ABC transporter ATP-binding protein n=1 Tax=Nocardioides houyundeii TaxID=2045452 RepID=UPI001963804F|nr:ABC transporter ATP-binding protein [Nocardioides houyundeii]
MSFTVRPGEIVGLIGPNGAGKTTLFNLVSGHLPVTSGRIEFAGVDVTSWPAYRRSRAGLARTFQIVRPMGSLTVAENVMVGAYAHLGRRRHAMARALEVMEQVELDVRPSTSAAALSLPHRKRLEVARAVASGAKVLLLDEVMAGLNATEAERAIAMIQRLNATGMAIVLIEHNLRVIRQLASFAHVLNHGKVIASGPPASVLSDGAVVEAYLGKKESA